MAGEVGDVVCLADRSRRINQIGVTLREVGELVIRGPDGLIRGTHHVVGIGEQGIGEALSFGESFVVGGGVEADAVDPAVGFGE